MAHSSYFESHGAPATRVMADHSFDVRGPSYQAYQLLHWGFVAAPVILAELGLRRLSHVYDRPLVPGRLR
jgi:hypothetical protein